MQDLQVKIAIRVTFLIVWAFITSLASTVLGGVDILLNNQNFIINLEIFKAKIHLEPLEDLAESRPSLSSPSRPEIVRQWEAKKTSKSTTWKWTLETDLAFQFHPKCMLLLLLFTPIYAIYLYLKSTSFSKLSTLGVLVSTICNPLNSASILKLFPPWNIH